MIYELFDNKSNKPIALFATLREAVDATKKDGRRNYWAIDIEKELKDE